MGLCRGLLCVPPVLLFFAIVQLTKEDTATVFDVKGETLAECGERVHRADANRPKNE